MKLFVAPLHDTAFHLRFNRAETINYISPRRTRGSEKGACPDERI